MSTQPLSSIAFDVVGQYTEAGKSLVRAYRVGSDRAVTAVNERFESVVNARTLPLVNDTLKANLIGAEQKIAGVVARGVTLGADGADVTIDRIARGVNVGLERLAGAGARVEGVVGTGTVERVNALALPAATLSLQIATFVAESSKLLSERVAGPEQIVVAPVKKAARKVAKKRATRSTRRA
jgi:hypothetical protein